MNRVIVNARIPLAKKEAANSVLESIGATPSELINSAYDYLLAFGKLPSAARDEQNEEKNFADFLDQTTFAIDWIRPIFRSIIETTSGKRRSKTMNLLLDTNVLIDYLGRREPFFSPAQRVMAAGFFGDVKLWIPVLSFKDAFYVLGRQTDPALLQHAFAQLNKVVSFVRVSEDDVLRAIRSGWSDLEDCLVAVCAEKARADYLITRDLEGFARSTIPAVQPETWLALMKEEHGLECEKVECFG